MERLEKQLDEQLNTLSIYQDDLDLLLERDERVSVGIENFNAYNKQYNDKLSVADLPSYETLEVGREGLGDLIRKVKNQLIVMIRSILNTMSIMFSKATSLTGMMIKGLVALESQIENEVRFDGTNKKEYQKLNEMNHLDGLGIESGMLLNIENVGMSYNESMGKTLDFVHKMVEYQVSWLTLQTKLNPNKLPASEYKVMIKQLRADTSNRAGTELKTMLDKKFADVNNAKFVHYAWFKTSKEHKLVVLDFKKCNKDNIKVKDEVCTKLKVIEGSAKRIINRHDTIDFIEADDIRDLLTKTIKSMEDYDPIDIEKAISDRILDIKKTITETKGKNRKAISNLSAIVNYYAALMRNSAIFIFNQHKMNYKSMKYLIQLSGE